MTPRLLAMAVLLAAPLALPAQTVHLTADANTVLRTVDDRLYGINLTMWDSLQSAPETAALVRTLQFGSMRCPGGSLSDDYNWSTNKRISDNPNWTWAVDAGQFALFIEQQSADAYVTVNYGSGTPEMAAAWVAYYNGTESDTRTIGTDAKGVDWKTVGYWAAMRGAAKLATDDGRNFLRISHPAPFGFKYWEVGNECYGSWENDVHGVTGSGLNGSAHDPYTYATEFKRFYDQMLAIDPTIRIGAVGTLYETEYGIGTHGVRNPRTGATYTTWMPVMLARLKELAVTPHFLIEHYYAQNPPREADAGLLQSSANLATFSSQDRQMLKDYLGDDAAAKVEMVMTELNSVSSNPGKQTSNLVNALFYADAYGAMARTEFNACLWWDLHNGAETGNNNSASLYGWRNFGCYDIIAGNNFPGVAPHTPLPTYYAAKLLTHWARGGDTVVASASDSTLLSCYAAKLADGRLSLLVVNKDPSNDVAAQIALSNFQPGSSTATVWSYGKPNDAQGSTTPDLTQTTIANVTSTFSRTFPSYSATVIVFDAPVAVPVISSQPSNAVAAPGGGATLTVTASGAAPLSYQWYKDGVALAGQTGTTLTLTNAQASDAGSYTVVVTNALGSATSNAANLTIATPDQLGRLSNLSARAVAGSGSKTLIIGLIISGNSGTKELLARGVGPTLGTSYNVPGTLADPSLSLFKEGGALLDTNDNWGGSASILDLLTRTGAFPFASATSKDAALGLKLTPGAYTVHVDTPTSDASGVVLAEFYDATASYAEDTPRLANLSARAQVGTDANVLIVGFVIGGSTPRSILVRAVGPTLASYNVAGVLANPRLELYQSHSPQNILLQTNDDWGTSSNLKDIQNAMTAVHAFPLPADSKDAIVLTTLNPGAYTAVISGVNGTTGVALAEVFLVP